MKYCTLIFLLSLLAVAEQSFSQDSVDDEFTYDVHINYPSLSLTRASLDSAKTVLDLNKYYKPSWVKEYLSVEIKAKVNGELKSAVNQNDQLSQEQKSIMNEADVGSDIAVLVTYIPDNTLSQNDAQTYDFTFTLRPDHEAEFIGGKKELQQYLKENAINKIPENIFTDYKLAAVKFTVSDQGEIIDAHNFWTSEDEKIDSLLYQTICTMPQWNPAKYSNNTKVNQEFVFTVGNMQSCVVNMLNINPDRPAYE